MTICISIKVPDGLVLAADSMTSYTVPNPTTGGIDVVQSYSYANKLIRISNCTVGTLIWGLASIQGRSIQNHVDEFSRGLNGATLTVQKIAEALSAFIKSSYEKDYPDPTTRPGLGFLVGGYDTTHHYPKTFAFEFPSQPTPIEIVPDVSGVPQFGANWFGQPDAIQRLLNGFDQRIIQGLKDHGFDPAKVDDYFSVQSLVKNRIPYEFVWAGMPLQDAIDLAAYLIHVVKGRFRFAVGPKLCGGPVDIAVITPQSFDWIKRKKLAHEHEI